MSAFSNPSRSSPSESIDSRLSKLDLTAEEAVASAPVTVTSESEPASAACSTSSTCCCNCVASSSSWLFACSPDSVSGRPRSARLSTLVGGPPHVLRGDLHGGLVERERVVGEGLDRLLDAGDPRAQLGADFACPLLARALLVAAAAPGQRGRGREREDDGEHAEATDGHLGDLRAPGEQCKRCWPTRMKASFTLVVMTSALVDRALSIGADPRDTTDERFRRRLLVGVALVILPVAVCLGLPVLARR